MCVQGEFLCYIFIAVFLMAQRMKKTDATVDA